MSKSLEQPSIAFNYAFVMYSMEFVILALNHCIEQNKFKFNADFTISSMDNMLKYVANAKYEFIRKVESSEKAGLTYSNVDGAMWQYRELFSKLPNTILSVFRIISAIIVLYNIDPTTIVISLTINIAFFVFYEKENTKNIIKSRGIARNEIQNLIHRIRSRIGSLFEVIIHHEEGKYIEEINKTQLLLKKEEIQVCNQESFKMTVSKCVNQLTIALSVLTFLWNLNSKEQIVMVLPLISAVRVFEISTKPILDFHRQYIRFMGDIVPFKKFVSEAEQRHKIVQFKGPIEIIEINYLRFVRKTVGRDDFILQTSKPLIIKQKEIILVTGEIGQGKSTFFDIFTGIIRPDESSISVNGQRLPCADFINHAFAKLETCRTLVLQDHKFDIEGSWYDIITNKLSVKEDKSIDEYIVLPEVSDRVGIIVQKIINVVELNSLFDKFKRNLQAKISILSGGERSQFALARSLFRAVKNQSQILLIDEFDKSLSEATSVKIVGNLKDWFGGIVMIIAHSEAVKKEVKYDQIFQVNNGTISVVQ